MAQETPQLPVGFTPYMHAAFLSEATNALSQAGIEELEYQKLVKVRLLKSIGYVCWRGLAEYAETHKLVVTDSRDKANDLIDQIIGRRLGVVATTSARWIKGETVPGSDQFFGALVLVLKKELPEVPFPKNKEIVWKSVSRTFTMIRELECKEAIRSDITREQFTCVWFLSRHPNADAMLTAGSQDRGQVIAAVVQVLNTRFGSTFTSQYVLNAVVNWMRAYLFFSLGLQRDWRHLDDSEVALT